MRINKIMGSALLAAVGFYVGITNASNASVKKLELEEKLVRAPSKQQVQILERDIGSNNIDLYGNLGLAGLAIFAAIYVNGSDYRIAEEGS